VAEGERCALVVCLQEISFFEHGEPTVDGDPGDLKVSTLSPVICNACKVCTACP
jgi:hypothetical protein